jgi:hypothetical protein
MYTPQISFLKFADTSFFYYTALPHFFKLFVGAVPCVPRLRRKTGRLPGRQCLLETAKIKAFVRYCPDIPADAVKFVYLYLALPIIKSGLLHTIQWGGTAVNVRKLTLGDRNLVGARVTQLRTAQGMKQVELLAKLQIAGIDIGASALSLLEGQRRPVTDKELKALSDIFGVSADWLLGR